MRSGVRRLVVACGLAPLSGATVARYAAPPDRGVAARGSPSASCHGAIGGGARVSDRVTMVYALRLDSAGARIEAVFLARGHAGWDRGSGLRRGAYPPLVDGRAIRGAGGTADTLALQYERAQDIAWVETRAVPLHGANVVLIDHADGVGGPITVRAPRRVDPRVAWPACDGPRTAAESEAQVAALQAAVARDPAVAAFLASEP